MRVNYKIYDGISDFFEENYKRKIRKWSITELHSLYLKSLIRYEMVYCMRHSIMNRIINETEETIDQYGNKVHKVYKYDHNDNVLSKKFEKRNDTYLISPWVYEFEDKDKAYVRNFILNELLNKYKIAFELGKLYDIEDNKRYFFHTNLRDLLIKEIADYLSDKFKNSICDNYQIVNLNGDRYLFVTESRYNDEHKFFKFVCNLPNDELIIE